MLSVSLTPNASPLQNDGKINEEDFIAFLGVTNPAEHQKQQDRHRERVAALRATIARCTEEASRIMQSGADDAGEKARALLAEKRRAQVTVEQEEAEMARKNKENADGLRSYNALKGRVAELEKRKAELERLTAEQCTDVLAEEHTHVTSQLKKFRKLMSAAAGADFKGTGPHLDREEKTEAEAVVAEALVALGSIPILRGLSNSERASLSQRLDSQTFAPGASIITQGEEGDSLFIVSSGDAEAEVRGVGVVRQYTTGQWFGELALVTNQPRKATVRAVTSCTTLRLQRTDFERLIGKLGAHMEVLRRRFGSAAYSFGRKDFSKLFRHYDRDNTGFLDLAQFRTACRKDGHVKVADVDDRELRCLYHLIDLNSDGKICEADWGHFLGGDDHSAAAPAPAVPSLNFEEGVPPHGSVPSKYSSPTSSVDEPFGAAAAGPGRSMPGAPREVMQLAASPAPGPPSDADTAEMLRSAGVGEQTVRALQSAEERFATSRLCGATLCSD